MIRIVRDDKQFEWDENKAAENYRKHRIRFERAIEVFDYPLTKYELNRIEKGEQRWKATGNTKNGMLLVVIHAVRENGIEITRIISARLADSEERKDYEHG